MVEGSLSLSGAWRGNPTSGYVEPKEVRHAHQSYSSMPFESIPSNFLRQNPPSKRENPSQFASLRGKHWVLYSVFMTKQTSSLDWRTHFSLNATLTSRTLIM